MSDLTTSTPYGTVDTAALLEAQQSFDTRVLLRMVEELDKFTIPARQEGGLRDQLLQLHAMAHAVINGARLSAPVGESLSDCASAILWDVQDAIGTLQGWVRALEVLRNLAPRD